MTERKSPLELVYAHVPPGEERDTLLLYLYHLTNGYDILFVTLDILLTAQKDFQDACDNTTLPDQEYKKAVKLTSINLAAAFQAANAVFSSIKRKTP